MVQIIFLHLFQYGGIHKAIYLKDNPSAAFIVDFMWCLSRTPVDVFVMISGYFLITSKSDIHSALQRCKKPYEGMLCYSLIIGIIFFIIMPELFIPAEVIKTLLPFFSRTWYFLDNYIIILLISPFLDKMLVALSKKEYLFFAGIVFLVMSVWSTLGKIDVISDVVNTSKVTDNYYGKSLGGFLTMYIIGGYIHLHIKDDHISVFKKRMCYLLLFFGMCILDFTLYSIFPEYKKVYGMFNNPLVIIESVVLILFFRSLTFSSNVINTLASTTLGVYIIHEHPYIRKWLWATFNMQNPSFYQNLSYIPLSVLVCLAVFSGCSLIELIRMKLFTIFTEHRQRKKVKQ